MRSSERNIYEVPTAEPSGRTPRCGRGSDGGGVADVRRLWGGGDTGTPGAEGSASGGGGDEEVAVTLITKTSTNPFFIAMQKGAEEAGQGEQRHHHDCRGQGGRRRGTQIQAIEAAIARGDKGILITPQRTG